MTVTNGKHHNVISLKERSKQVNIVPSPAISLVEAKERIDLLKQFVKEMMIEGVDYGVIEGWQKPTLLKPGAEKLCDIFGFSKQVTIINRIENWEKGIFSYLVKVTLVNKETSLMEAEGVGSCNNKEKSFIDQDPFTLVNTVLKMAKKRALIDAILSATGASGIFTQDIEDLKIKSLTVTNHTVKQQDMQSVTQRQLKAIFNLVDELNITSGVARELMRMMFQVDHSTELTKVQASKFIQDLLLLKNNRSNGI